MPVTRSRTTSTRSAEETGAGLLSTLLGVTAFLILLLFGVHVVLNLYAASTVTAVAFDAAREVAGADGGPAAQAAAEARARDVLGRAGRPDVLRLAWAYPSTDGDGEPDLVELRVRAESPSAFLPGVPLPLASVDRTIRVRLERPR
jgi:hypothetical protein